METRHIGRPVPRNEDRRLLRGKGLFIDDIELPAMLHATFLRSTYAHARIADIEVKEPDAQIEHEATTSKIGEDELFYCRQRGIEEEDAVNMIVNGFCKEVFKELPMEFAVEAQNLLAVSPEGAVG